MDFANTKYDKNGVKILQGLITNKELRQKLRTIRTTKILIKYSRNKPVSDKDLGKEMNYCPILFFGDNLEKYVQPNNVYR